LVGLLAVYFFQTEREDVGVEVPGEEVERAGEEGPWILSVDFKAPPLREEEGVPPFREEEGFDFVYSIGTNMILEIEGDYETVCLENNREQLAENVFCGPEETFPTHPLEEEEKNGVNEVTFLLNLGKPGSEDEQPTFVPILCHHQSDFHEVHFYEERIEDLSDEAIPIKTYSCEEIKDMYLEQS